MNYLSAENLAKSYSDRYLFKEINIGISEGEKIALVGENGTGKSTLLKILAGVVIPDDGVVVKREGLKVGYLVQQPMVEGNLTINDIIFSTENKVATLVKEYEKCIHHPDEVSPEKMQQVLEKMEELNAWEYDSKVLEVTSRLGLDDLDKSFSTLSGGQRKRVFLAQLLLQEPNLLLMDEPTNHLDIEAIEWLENYLSAQSITIIMVTHDRYFLDNVANKIMELDRGKLYSYNGNYAYFLEKKADREEKLTIEVTKAKNLLRKELEWMRKQPRARGTKSKYRVEAFYELQEKASQNLKRDRLELDIKEARQGGKIVEIENVSKSFGEQKIIDRFSYVFKKFDRIGVVGKNGVGKSTFLNMLTGNLKPDSGEMIAGVTTKMAYFTQETQDLNPSHRLIEEVKQIAEFITLSDGTQISASKFLEQFLFPSEKQYTFIEKLSGGEKKRLQLLKLLITNPNFLILDEPTNDFDIETLNVLEDFLEKFQGCLLLVSHDRYFMDHLVDQLFVLEGDGVIRIFNGNYSDYRESLENAEEPEPVVVEKTAKPKELKKLSFQEKKEYEALPELIQSLEEKKSRLMNAMNESGKGYEELTKLGEELKALEREVEEKTMRWLELEEKAG